MADAIKINFPMWLEQTKDTDPNIKELDIVIGLTYGTDKTTNNKENQILAKLLNAEFIEEDRLRYPGVIIDKETRSVRVYRRIGKDFWAFIGNPQSPELADHVYLEILLALTKALSLGAKSRYIEDRINIKIRQLTDALSKLQFPRESLPNWIRNDFSEAELFWFATAMTAFFDEGI